MTGIFILIFSLEAVKWKRSALQRDASCNDVCGASNMECVLCFPQSISALDSEFQAQCQNRVVSYNASEPFHPSVDPHTGTCTLGFQGSCSAVATTPGENTTLWIQRLCPCSASADDACVLIEESPVTPVEKSSFPWEIAIWVTIIVAFIVLVVWFLPRFRRKAAKQAAEKPKVPDDIWHQDVSIDTAADRHARIDEHVEVEVYDEDMEPEPLPALWKCHVCSYDNGSEQVTTCRACHRPRGVQRRDSQKSFYTVNEMVAMSAEQINAAMKGQKQARSNSVCRGAKFEPSEVSDMSEREGGEGWDGRLVSGPYFSGRDCAGRSSTVSHTHNRGTNRLVAPSQTPSMPHMPPVLPEPEGEDMARTPRANGARAYPQGMSIPPRKPKRQVGGNPHPFGDPDTNLTTKADRLRTVISDRAVAIPSQPRAGQLPRRNTNGNQIGAPCDSLVGTSDRTAIAFHGALTGECQTATSGQHSDNAIKVYETAGGRSRARDHAGFHSTAPAKSVPPHQGIATQSAEVAAPRQTRDTRNNCAPPDWHYAPPPLPQRHGAPTTNDTFRAQSFRTVEEASACTEKFPSHARWKSGTKAGGPAMSPAGPNQASTQGALGWQGRNTSGGSQADTSAARSQAGNPPTPQPLAPAKAPAPAQDRTASPDDGSGCRFDRLPEDSSSWGKLTTPNRGPPALPTTLPTAHGGWNAASSSNHNFQASSSAATDIRPAKKHKKRKLKESGAQESGTQESDKKDMLNVETYTMDIEPGCASIEEVLARARDRQMARSGGISYENAQENVHRSLATLQSVLVKTEKKT